MDSSRRLCPPKRSPLRSVVPVTLILAAAGCDPRTGPEPDPPLPTSCADPGGREHAGAMPPGHFVWRAADGPHRLVESVMMDSLTIEAGALVCGGPDAEIRLGYFSAVGSADAPIVLTAEDPARPWGGIDASRPTLSHVVLEHATRGFRVRFEGSVRNSLLRQIRGSAIVVQEAQLDILETTIDSSCLAATAGCFAVSAGRWTDVRFEESAIRNSGGGGLRVDGHVRGAQLTLSGGTIEGSAGIGLHARTSALGLDRPVRITGGATHPARVSLGLAAAHTATPELQEMWSGNASDTLLILSTTTSTADSVTIRPGQVWLFEHAPSGHGVRALVLEPGANAVVEGFLRAGRLVSEGTADDPVEIMGSSPAQSFSGLAISGDEAGPSRVAHTRLKHTSMTVNGPPGFVGRDLVLDSSRVRLAASNIRIERMRLGSDRITITSQAPLEISGEDVVIEGCEITGSAMAGIRVTSSGGVRISHCNIHGHGGLGLVNLSDAPVDARNNWWGDPAGPHGPDGAGVSGNVLYEPWLTEPVPADRLPRTGDDR